MARTCRPACAIMQRPSGAARPCAASSSTPAPPPSPTATGGGAVPPAPRAPDRVPPLLAIALTIRIADCGGPTRPPAWVDEQVQPAQPLLPPHGIALTAHSESFKPPACEAVTRQDRDGF